MPALTVEPETLEEIHEFRTLATTETGALFRRNAYPEGKAFRRVYRLQWSMASEATADALTTLLRTTNGTGTFTWTPPGGVSRDFVIVDNAISITYSSPTFRQIEMTIEEV